MAEIRWTNEAHLWLRDIFNYIATDNKDAAQKIVTGIYKKFNTFDGYRRSVAGIGKTIVRGRLNRCWHIDHIDSGG